EVTNVVGDDVVRVAVNRAMVERVILRVRRVLPALLNLNQKSGLAQQVDEPADGVARHLQPPQYLAVLREYSLAEEPVECVLVFYPREYEDQFGGVGRGRLLPQGAGAADDGHRVYDETRPLPTPRHQRLLLPLRPAFLPARCAAMDRLICSLPTSWRLSETFERASRICLDQPAGRPRFPSR